MADIDSIEPVWIGKHRHPMSTCSTTISNRFTALLGRLQPSQSEMDRLAKHIESVTAKISNVEGTIKTLVMGSVSRGSSISGSDADLLVVLSRDSIRRGDDYVRLLAVIVRIRRALESRFWSSKVRRDGQAVVIGFADGHHLDVVPSCFGRPHRNGWPVFQIPSMGNEWIETSPSLHNHYICSADRESGGKLKYVAQLVKHWRGCRAKSVPFSSFYLEMLLAQSGLCAGVRSYRQCLNDVFQLLVERQCRPLRDPHSVSRNIPVARTQAQFAECMDAVTRAHVRIRAAMILESKEKTEPALNQWRVLFQGDFPAT